MSSPLLVSEAQLEANRENAKSSTGPFTAEGKAKVKLNAVRHGFAGQTVVVAEHERPAYVAHFQSFVMEYKPATPTECFLVQSLADLSFSVGQIRCEMTTYMSMQSAKPTNHATGDDVALAAAVAQAANIAEQAKTLNLLGIYEQRKTRLFLATRNELARIQAERKAAVNQELTAAAKAREAAKSTQPNWTPEANGFVCSNADLDRFLTRLGQRTCGDSRVSSRQNAAKSAM